MAEPGEENAPKIASIYISDFRAFPALAPVSGLLNGKNSLAWGENGSGKSSIYRALRGLFSVRHMTFRRWAMSSAIRLPRASRRR